MSIPLDRLYHYLESLCSEDILIYRWSPHGSKKLDDLTLLHSENLPDLNIERLLIPNMICHDQEPLFYNYYSYDEFLNVVKNSKQAKKVTQEDNHWPCSEEFYHTMALSHLRTKLKNPMTLHDYVLLCHSEKNSKELIKYEQNGFVGVYYWSHAVIARDWFRFAQHDNRLNFDVNNIKTDFLIYNRAWSGTREYRLKFSELLVDKELVKFCNTKFNPIDNSQHYTKFQPKNPKLKINRDDIDSAFVVNESTSNYSADYDVQDYCHSAIEVVLETLFDDVRWHLTEKTLRPIACGKPFIIASTPGILDYLKSYGFKTFNGLIDESYNTVVNPLHRLQRITDELNRLALLPQKEKYLLWKELHKIADYNKTHFFSNNFHDHVTGEFVQNLNTGINKCKENMSGKFWNLAYANKYDEITEKVNCWLAQST